MFTFFWQVHRSTRSPIWKLSNALYVLFLFFSFFLCWFSFLCRSSGCWLQALRASRPLCWESPSSTAPPAGARQDRWAHRERLRVGTAGTRPWGAPWTRRQGGERAREARLRAATPLLTAATRPTPSTTTHTEGGTLVITESKQKHWEKYANPSRKGK